MSAFGCSLQIQLSVSNFCLSKDPDSLHTGSSYSPGCVIVRVSCSTSIPLLKDTRRGTFWSTGLWGRAWSLIHVNPPVVSAWDPHMPTRPASLQVPAPGFSAFVIREEGVELALGVGAGSERLPLGKRPACIITRQQHGSGRAGTLSVYVSLGRTCHPQRVCTPLSPGSPALPPPSILLSSQARAAAHLASLGV